ncbi:hypothetical protein DERF_011239 [Dermatophagoides farinae]|uniref:Uncharacterized protein n=1 Tax=Dermatophagoides farinae TaxID=6954 RepID=A0A922HV10_DERFA|nr:hypothetical protein DERF_011239 [Dermatophagoides farinae]
MVIINHFGVRNNDDDIDNNQDGHPIQQSMTTKMAIMNRHHPATLIDSPNMMIMSPQLQHHNFQHHQQQQRNITYNWCLLYKNDHGNDAEHYKFIGGYLFTDMVRCPMKHHVHHQVTLKFRYQSMILTLTFLKGLHWIEFSEQLIRFVPEILQSSN